MIHLKMNIIKIIGNNTKGRYIFIGGIVALLAIGSVFVNTKESSAQDLFQQANELFLSHDFQGAEDMYLRVLDTNATTQWAHHQLGRVYFSRSELKKALDEFNQEIALHKDSVNAFYMRGLTYVFLEYLELGEKDFRTFLDAKPNSEAGNNDFAQILFVQGKFQEAKKVLTHILSFYPESFLAKQGLGAVYLELGEFTKAKQYIQNTLDTVLAMDVSTFMKYYPSLNPKNAEDGIATIREGIRYNLTIATFGEQGLFDKEQVTSKSFAPYFQSALGEQRQGAVFLAASCEADFEHFSNECFDTISPSVSISVSPSSSVDEEDTITFLASAFDNFGVVETRIFIDENNDGNYNDNGKTCTISACVVTTGPYEVGQIVKYYATAKDAAGNSANTLTTPRDSFTVLSSPPTNVTLFASPVGSVANGTTVTYTAVTDKEISEQSPYWIYIFRGDSVIVSCKTGNTCSRNQTNTDITYTFTAKVARADFSDVIATDSISTTWSNPDITPPTSTIDGPTAGSWQNKNFVVSVSDSDNTGGSGLSSCDYGVFNDPNGWIVPLGTHRVCGSPLNISVGATGDCRNEGINKCQVQIRSQDNAGKESPIAFRAFSIDYQSPTGSITASPSSISSGDSIVVSMSGFDNIEVDRLHWLEENQIYSSCGGLSSCNHSWPITIFTPGEYTFSGRIYDAVGKSVFVQSNIVTVVGEPVLDSPLPTTHWQRLWYSISGSSPNVLFGSYLAESSESSLFFDTNWGSGALVSTISDSIGFQSGRTVDFGALTDLFRFTIGADDGVRLLIDGIERIGQWSEGSYRTKSENIALSGFRELQLDYYENGGNAKVSFTYELAPLCQPPSDATGNLDCSSSPTEASINLNWGDNFWDDMAGITSYQVQWKVDGETLWSSADPNPNTSIYTIRGLAPNTKYNLRMRGLTDNNTICNTPTNWSCERPADASSSDGWLSCTTSKSSDNVPPTITINILSGQEIISNGDFSIDCESMYFQFYS